MIGCVEILVLNGCPYIVSLCGIILSLDIFDEFKTEKLYAKAY